MNDVIKYAITNELIKYAITNDIIKYAITNDVIKYAITKIKNLSCFQIRLHNYCSKFRACFTGSYWLWLFTVFTKKFLTCVRIHIIHQQPLSTLNPQFASRIRKSKIRAALSMLYSMLLQKFLKLG